MLHDANNVISVNVLPRFISLGLVNWVNMLRLMTNMAIYDYDDVIYCMLDLSLTPYGPHD